MTMTSFTAIGTPASGPNSSPFAICSSTRLAAFKSAVMADGQQRVRFWVLRLGEPQRLLRQLSRAELFRREGPRALWAIVSVGMFISYRSITRGTLK